MVWVITWRVTPALWALGGLHVKKIKLINQSINPCYLIGKIEHWFVRRKMPIIVQPKLPPPPAPHKVVAFNQRLWVCYHYCHTPTYSRPSVWIHWRLIDRLDIDCVSIDKQVARGCRPTLHHATPLCYALSGGVCGGGGGFWRPDSVRCSIHRDL